MLGNFEDKNLFRVDLIRRWDEPREHEPAHAYFSRLAGLNMQTSARVFAIEMGLDGHKMLPSECLDAIKHLPIKGLDRLIHATPEISGTKLVMMGQTFRRRQWTGALPRVCPGCLSESPHFRAFHGLTSMFVCPFYGLEIISSAGHRDPLAWWHPNIAISPKGVALARPVERLDPLPVTFERWLLGRMNVCDPLCVPLLDVGGAGEAIDAIDIIGRGVIGGWRIEAPKTGRKGNSRDVLEAGFKLIHSGADTLRAFFKNLAKQAEGRTGMRGCKWGVQHAYGWLSLSMVDDRAPSPILDGLWDIAESVAKVSGRYFRGGRNLRKGNIAPGRIHREELARRTKVRSGHIDLIAARLGFKPVREAGRFVLFDAPVADAITNAIADSVQRNEAAKSLGLVRSDFDELEQRGLISPLCRLGGGNLQFDRFQRCDLNKLLPSPDLQCTDADGLHLMDLQAFSRTTQMGIPEIVEKVLEGKITPVGRCSTRVGVNAFLFDLATADTLSRENERRQYTSIGRLRRLRELPGIALVDAAARFGTDMATIRALIESGRLRLVDPMLSGTKRARIQSKSFERFCKRYAPVTAYANALGCQPSESMRILVSLGVNVQAVQRRHGTAWIVLRADVVKALRWATDPLDEPGGVLGFWHALAAYLTVKKSVFRLTRMRNQPEVILRSGDRRTSIRIEITDGGTISAEIKCDLFMHERRHQIAATYSYTWIDLSSGKSVLRTSKTGFDLTAIEQYQKWVEWLHIVANQLRTFREGWEEQPPRQSARGIPFGVTSRKSTKSQRSPAQLLAPSH